jgi:four helix bundle protein
MRLIAFDLALDLVTALIPTLATFQRHNARLAKQLDDASTSIALNIAEATGRFGRDRAHHFRIALGSLREVGAALKVARAKGWIAELPMEAERDRLGGLLYGLQRK